MVSSEWGDPEAFLHGFNPAHVAEGKSLPFSFILGTVLTLDNLKRS